MLRRQMVRFLMLMVMLCTSGCFGPILQFATIIMHNSQAQKAQAESREPDPVLQVVMRMPEIDDQYLYYDDRTYYLLIDDSLDSVWLRTGYALQRAGAVAIIEYLPGMPGYVIGYTRTVTAKPNENGAAGRVPVSGVAEGEVGMVRVSDSAEGLDRRHQIRLRPDRAYPGYTRIYVYNGRGEPTSLLQARFVLALIAERIGIGDSGPEPDFDSDVIQAFNPSAGSQVVAGTW